MEWLKKHLLWTPILPWLRLLLFMTSCSYERHSHMSFNKGHSVHSLFLFMTLLSAAMDVLPWNRSHICSKNWLHWYRFFYREDQLKVIVVDVGQVDWVGLVTVALLEWSQVGKARPGELLAEVILMQLERCSCFIVFDAFTLSHFVNQFLGLFVALILSEILPFLTSHEVVRHNWTKRVWHYANLALETRLI